jgi:hypothetical protein
MCRHAAKQGAALPDAAVCSTSPEECRQMSSAAHHSELLQLLEELDRLAEEQRVIDVRDPHALAECERKLAEIRRRIERLKRTRPDGVGYA